MISTVAWDFPGGEPAHPTNPSNATAINLLVKRFMNRTSVVGDAGKRVTTGFAESKITDAMRCSNDVGAGDRTRTCTPLREEDIKFCWVGGLRRDYRHTSCSKSDLPEALLERVLRLLTNGCRWS